MSAEYEKIVADLKDAMKARDDLKKAVLRSIKAAIDKERENKPELDSATCIAIIARQHKSRIEAYDIYKQNNDTERAEAELCEAKLIEQYLPKQLDEAEVDKHIEDTIAKSGASSPADMGKVMGQLSGVLTGKADMKQVSAKVRAKLSS